MSRDVETLRRAAKRLREKPSGYSQRTFGRMDEDSVCGTVTCIAGEIMISSAPTEEEGLRLLWSTIRRDGHSDISNFACRVVGIGEFGDARKDVFGMTADAWPEPFRSDWFRADGDQERMAFAAADFLDYLAEGGELIRIGRGGRDNLW